MQDATREMKEMVLKKAATTDSPRRRRTRSGKKSKGARSKLDGDASAPCELKPRRLDFEEDSEAALDEDSDSPVKSDDGGSPAPRDHKDVSLEEATPEKDKVPRGDDDLFTGPFARPNSSPREKPYSAKSKKSSAEKRRKSPKPGIQFSSLPTVPPTAEELQDEEDLKNDPIMKLMDKIRENRLMSILPLNCNPNFDSIQCMHSMYYVLSSCHVCH